MYVVKVDDGFVEWVFELEGSDEYSIQNLVDVICKNTNLHVVKSAQQNMYLTALRRWQAWAIWGIVTLLSILWLLFGGR